MRRLKTLRVRFALWTAGLLFGALVIFGIFVYANMSRSLATVVDETLHLTAMQLIAEIEPINLASLLRLPIQAVKRQFASILRQLSRKIRLLEFFKLFKICKI